MLVFWFVGSLFGRSSHFQHRAKALVPLDSLLCVDRLEKLTSMDDVHDRLPLV